MKSRKHHRQQSYLSYIWIFAVGLTVLYSFSLLPRTTGYVVAELPEACGNYDYDHVCDDSQADCGVFYLPGESLDACDECQTGRFGC